MSSNNTEQKEMRKCKVLPYIYILCFTGFGLINQVIAQSYITSITDLPWKIKTGGAIIAQTYPTKEAADDAALAISAACKCQANAIGPTNIATTVLAKASSSSKASSSAAPQVAKLLKPVDVTASTTRSPNTPANAVDGNPETRYESAWLTDPTWVKFDLGSSYALGRIEIDWEDSSAADFIIEGSATGSTWVSLVSKVDAPFGARTDDFDISGTYRYLRINATKRPPESNWGYSIYEVRITSAGAASSSSSAASSQSSQAQSSMQQARVQVDATALSFEQPLMNLSEISHYTIVKIEPGLAGVSARVEKTASLLITVLLPWKIYQGDELKVFTWGTNGALSAPAEVSF